jgi:hypothetical protein
MPADDSKQVAGAGNASRVEPVDVVGDEVAGQFFDDLTLPAWPVWPAQSPSRRAEGQNTRPQLVGHALFYESNRL